jgi:hypothetical protein
MLQSHDACGIHVVIDTIVCLAFPDLPVNQQQCPKKLPSHALSRSFPSSPTRPCSESAHEVHWRRRSLFSCPSLLFCSSIASCAFSFGCFALQILLFGSLFSLAPFVVLLIRKVKKYYALVPLDSQWGTRTPKCYLRRRLKTAQLLHCQCIAYKSTKRERKWGDWDCA